MTLTALDISRFVRRRMDGEPSLPVVNLCNYAGRHLVQMHEWNWLVRPPVALRLQAGVSYCYPPDDFGREVTPQNSPSPGWRLFSIVSLRELAALRESVSLPAGPYRHYAAPVYEKCAERGLRLRLELHPTPTETSLDVKLWYRAKWAEIQDETTPIPIPESLDLLFLELVCAIAQGVDEPEEGTSTMRLAELAISPLFRDAVASDGLLTSSPQPMRGGMVNHPMDGLEGWTYYPSSTPSFPS